ncbi:MAG: hypothetical protein GXP49_11030 [Deltaproteobacteria bacterium]|nr:hypothetical protein [Deltaproteobacteria bacterium]
MEENREDRNDKNKGPKDESGGDAAWPDAKQEQGPAQVRPGGGDFTLGDILEDAYKALKENLAAFVGAMAINLIANGALMRTRFSMLNVFFSEHFSVGMTLMAFSAYRKTRKPEVGDLFFPFTAYVPVFLAGLVFTLALVVGFVLLIVPGIYIALTYGLLTPLLAEDVMKVRDGSMKPSDIDWWGKFKQSEKLMEGYRIKLLLYGIVLTLIGISGIIAFGVGIFFTMPIAFLGFIAFYERLRAVKGV